MLNTGTLSGGLRGAGVLLGGGGVVVNAVGGLIQEGSNGIAILAGGGTATITNAGTISGTIAIGFVAGQFADRVILDPGAVLRGQVRGGTFSNTLELAAGSVGVTGTVSSFGTEFTGFGTITLDKGANWLLDGVAPAGQAVSLTGGSVLSLDDTAGFADPISGFGNTDVLDLRDVAFAAGAKATLLGSTLTVSSGATTDTLTLLGLRAGTSFAVSNDGAGHVLIDETVSPTAGHTASTSPRFLAGTTATLPHAVVLAQVSQTAMADSLHGFMRLGAASATWSANAVGVAHAVALHAMPASVTQLARLDQGNRESAHPTWLHHAS